MGEGLVNVSKDQVSRGLEPTPPRSGGPHLDRVSVPSPIVTAGVTLANAKSFVLAFSYKIIRSHTLKAA